MKRAFLSALVVACISLCAADAFASPCLIFVHGKQTDTNTFTSYTSARNYWVTGSYDMVKDATRNYATSYYVVGYNGTSLYYDVGAAKEVANEIVAATNGTPDAGGHACPSYASGGTFIVVAHSMGATVMDFILGNSRTTDPNYNFGGAAYNTVAARVSWVMSVGGAHRGSEGADAACGASSWSCNLIASWIQGCDPATQWLQSADSWQVRGFSNAPAKSVYLTGGYEAMGSSGCLSGEDDGVVQYSSIFACNGATNVGYDNSNVCGNSSKQETSGFFNADGAHENHDDERNGNDRDTRRMVPGGIWTCSGVPCAANASVQSAMSTAQFVGIMW